METTSRTGSTGTQEGPQIDSGGIGRFHGRFAGAILVDSMGPAEGMTQIPGDDRTMAGRCPGKRIATSKTGRFSQTTTLGAGTPVSTMAPNATRENTASQPGGRTPRWQAGSTVPGSRNLWLGSNQRSSERNDTTKTKGLNRFLVVSCHGYARSAGRPLRKPVVRWSMAVQKSQWRNSATLDDHAQNANPHPHPSHHGSNRPFAWI